MEPKKSLTATNLAVHQHLNCDLYIHNVYNKAFFGHKSRSSSPSGLAQAHFKRGNDWESVLYSWLDTSGLLLKVPAVPLRADTLLENILADERTHFFITGLCFWPPQAKLNERYLQTGTKPLNFSLAKPDLIEVKRTNNGIQWRVIDAKASKNVKTSHHVQIYFYTLCLNQIFHPPFHTSANSAGIWLPPKEGFQVSPPSIADIKSISISLLAPAFDAFLFEELPHVISQPSANVNWHYNPACRGCQYESDCKSRALAEKSLGMMPNISIDDVKNLNELLRISQSSHLPDIEELHGIISNSTKLEQIAKSSPTILKKSKQILLLPKKGNGIFTSPAVEAARTQKIQVVSRRNYTCPSHEEIAVIVTLVNDPSSPNIGGDYFCVTTHSGSGSVPLPPSFCCPASQFIAKLASLIRLITTGRHTCQFYIWTSPEQLQAHIINAALDPDDNHADDIRLCIGTLAEGASLLQTTFQPLLLSGGLLSFLAKGKQTKSEYKACLARLGLSTDGTIEVLRKRIAVEVQRIRDEAAASFTHDQRRKEIGQLPRVVALKKEIERQLALPIPGYWDFPECVAILLHSDRACSTDEEIFFAYKNLEREDLDILLLRRNQSMFSVLKEFRKCVVIASKPRTLFVNEAKVLTSSIMDLCKEPHIRKLFFMQQFEVLAKLTELWRSRIDGCPDAPLLEYSGISQGDLKSPEHVFRLLSGEVDAPAADKDYLFYDKLLVFDSTKLPDNESSCEDLPVEAIFDDLLVSGLMFPLNRWTMPAWGQQEPRVQRELLIANVSNVYTKGTHKTMVALQIWPRTTSGTMFKVGDTYRLSPRLVDFNTSKILSTLFETDLQWESEGALWDDDEDDLHHDIPFLQLIVAPNSFGKIHDASKYLKTEGEIQKLFRDLKSLGNNVAGSLVLKSSQHRAAQRILSNRLSVIWGPPGTGKTYTISLSLLRLLEVERRHCAPTQKIIFITAITHAAIEACRSKLEKLMKDYRSIESLPHQWLDDVQVDVVHRGGEHPAPPKSGHGIRIYMGTLFQLYNFTKKHTMQIDCVIVDEAGQISLGAIGLVLRSLAIQGRIIIAGDSEQLAPILTAQYPHLKSGSLFGSVLDCFMSTPLTSNNLAHEESSQVINTESQVVVPASQNTIVQLTENFRLNPDLGEFISTIYARRFKPQKVQARQLAMALKSLSHNVDEMRFGNQPAILHDMQAFLVALSQVMLKQPQDTLVEPEINTIAPILLEAAVHESASAIHRPVSLSLIRLQTYVSCAEHVGYESHVHIEAAVAASLVRLLQHCSPHEDIFVATPHRIQREAVNAALARVEYEKGDLNEQFRLLTLSKFKVTVDTIERLQGSEAAFVICLFSLPKAHTSGLKFLLERRRLNVAISRAKTLCILLTSDEVLCPSVKVLADEEVAMGYAFLKAYEKRAWTYNFSLNMDTFCENGIPVNDL